jgi:CheY-like chemotaxis protein
LNLATNAVHAMKEKGILEILVSEVVLSEDEVSHQPNLKPGDYVELTMRDTGTGMDAVTMARIFDPFFTTKEVGEGTGMGLAVVHGIVKNHGGFITVDSRVGEGSTFRVYFPVTERVVSEADDLGEGEFSGTERILFVDDEKTIAKLGELTLARFGYKVHAISSSLEALELFRLDPNAFDLVVTDQSMPKMSGYELAAEMLNIRPDLPVILCTGYSTMISAEEAKAAGIREFLMKPIGEMKLARAVRRVLDSQAAPKA